MINFMVRPYNDTDVPFITNSWLKSAHSCGTSYHVRNTIYYKGMVPLINKLIDRAGVLVVCDPAAPNVIIGWMCAEWIDVGHKDEPVIHYIYVKRDFRGFRIAKHLYDLMAGPLRVVPFATHKGLKYKRAEYTFQHGHRTYNKHTFLVREPVYQDMMTEYDPWLLARMQSLDLKPIAHKTTL